MGTRHLIAVYIDGDYKVAQYGAYDGYPSGAGVQTLDFIRKVMNEGKIEAFKSKIRKSSFYTDDEWKSCLNKQEMNPGCGCEILDLILDNNDGFKTVNNINFAADSLWCEWCWVIDLNKDTFEGYSGFNQIKLDEDERFAFLNDISTGTASVEKYYPVRFVHSWSLKQLPKNKEFLKIMENCDEEEDDNIIVEEIKHEVKRIPFDSFDSTRYCYLDKKAMYQYCANLATMILENDNLVLVSTDYTGHGTIIVNMKTLNIYRSKNRPGDEYVKLFGIGVAAAKATGNKIPILIKEHIKDIKQIREGMQLLVWYKDHKKPYNQTVDENNIEDVKKLLKSAIDEDYIKKIYSI